MIRTRALAGVAEAIRAEARDVPIPLRKVGMEQRIGPFIVGAMLTIPILAPTGAVYGTRAQGLATLLLLALAVLYLALQGLGRGRALKLALPPLSFWIAFWPDFGSGAAAITGIALLTMVTVGWMAVFVIPWERLPRSLGVLPVALVIGALFPINQGGLDTSQVVLVMALLMVVWLAVYDTRAKVCVGVALLGGLFIAQAVSVGTAPQHLATAVLLIAGAALLGALLQRLVRAAAQQNRLLGMEREMLHSVISGLPVILFAVDAERRLTLGRRQSP
jgi:hypothetical protein